MKPLYTLEIIDQYGEIKLQPCSGPVSFRNIVQKLTAHPEHYKQQSVTQRTAVFVRVLQANS